MIPGTTPAKRRRTHINKDINFFKDIPFNIEDIIPQSKKYSSIIDYVNFGFYNKYKSLKPSRRYSHRDHKYGYDFEKINLLLKSIGFKNIIRDDFNPKKDSLSYNKMKKRYRMYIEAEK